MSQEADQVLTDAEMTLYGADYDSQKAVKLYHVWSRAINIAI